jgi:hypothetical protein
LTCGFISWTDDVCPVEHFHEVAVGDEQGDVAVPLSDHLTGNNASLPVMSLTGRYLRFAAAIAQSGARPTPTCTRTSAACSTVSWTALSEPGAWRTPGNPGA